MPNDLCPYCGALKNAEHTNELCKAKELIQELVNAHLAWMRERDFGQWEQVRPKAEAFLKPLTLKEHYERLENEHAS